MHGREAEVTDEVLLYQPAWGQDWCAEQIFDVSWRWAMMGGDEEWKPCLDTAEWHRNTKTNSTLNKNFYYWLQLQKIKKGGILRWKLWKFYSPVYLRVKNNEGNIFLHPVLTNNFLRLSIKVIAILRYKINEKEKMYHIEKQDTLWFQVLKCKSCLSFTVFYI